MFTGRVRSYWRELKMKGVKFPVKGFFFLKSDALLDYHKCWLILRWFTVSHHTAGCLWSGDVWLLWAVWENPLGVSAVLSGSLNMHVRLRCWSASGAPRMLSEKGKNEFHASIFDAFPCLWKLNLGETWVLAAESSQFHRKVTNGKKTKPVQ